MLVEYKNQKEVLEEYESNLFVDIIKLYLQKKQIESHIAGVKATIINVFKLKFNREKTGIIAKIDSSTIQVKSKPIKINHNEESLELSKTIEEAKKELLEKNADRIKELELEIDKLKTNSKIELMQEELKEMLSKIPQPEKEYEVAVKL